MQNKTLFIVLLSLIPVVIMCSKGGGGDAADSQLSLANFYSLDDLSNLAKNSGKTPSYSTSGSENGLISMGDLSTCVVMTSGKIKCWGFNGSFQLGNTQAVTANQQTPVYTNILNDNAVAVSAALNHTCAYLIAGGMKCWGSQNNGKLGNKINTNTYANTPQDVVNLNGNQIKMMVTGDEHVCVLFSGTQQVMCWGANNKGQLAQNYTNSSDPPVIAGVNIALPESVKLIATSDDSVCAITISGNLYCWGSNITQSTNPNPVLIDSGVKNISSGEKDHFCYISANDFVNCFGINDKMQLGSSTINTTFVKTPVKVPNLVNVTAIVAGAFHSCAISDNNASVYCWGDNSLGQLGSSNSVPSQSNIPLKVVGLPANKVIDIAAGDRVTCTLHDNDDVFCWGNNNAPTTPGSYGDFLGVKNPPSFSNTAIKILNRNDQ
ncbi:RCC1 domain-containing protein [Fluviispira multicolorata]|uniref:Alpha-tubulin suppressor-like RCC1 family protein n=1 Tax=Fluviispira multicolorata TaxID=2654512 RepID=A0A833JHS8_9BACT|nr:hypothetical protein [Fluviispira multicolorata]KAB8033688.1 hypothetical protein GCL57_02990 [Fluviispira multicolorata]